MTSVMSKQHVIAEATRAFRDVGPTCSMAEVARRLGVPRRRMYTYFEDLLAMQTAVSEGQLQAMEALEAAKTSLRSRFRTLLGIIFDIEMCGIAKICEYEYPYLDVRLSTFLALVEEGRRTKTLVISSDDSVVAQFCFHVLEGHANEIKEEFGISDRIEWRRLDAAAQAGQAQASIEKFSGLFERVLGIMPLEQHRSSAPIDVEP